MITIQSSCFSKKLVRQNIKQHLSSDLHFEDCCEKIVNSINVYMERSAP